MRLEKPTDVRTDWTGTSSRLQPSSTRAVQRLIEAVWRKQVIVQRTPGANMHVYASTERGRRQASEGEALVQRKEATDASNWNHLTNTNLWVMTHAGKSEQFKTRREIRLIATKLWTCCLTAVSSTSVWRRTSTSCLEAALVMALMGLGERTTHICITIEMSLRVLLVSAWASSLSPKTRRLIGP